MSKEITTPKDTAELTKTKNNVVHPGVLLGIGILLCLIGWVFGPSVGGIFSIGGLILVVLGIVGLIQLDNKNRKNRLNNSKQNMDKKEDKKNNEQ